MKTFLTISGLKREFFFYMLGIMQCLFLYNNKLISLEVVINTLLACHILKGEEMLDIIIDIEKSIPLRAGALCSWFLCLLTTSALKIMRKFCV